MEIIVGTDSTWSLRVWMCLELAKLEVSETVVDLGAADYKVKLLALSPTGLVPALVDGALTVHDSLAITEYINERADGVLYPEQSTERAIARSLCAEMHAGFIAVRGRCPFTLSTVATIDVTELTAAPLSNELVRIEAIFANAKLPFMFESASAVDAFYAILAFRLNHYGIQFDGKAGAYQSSLLEWDLLQRAIAQAKQWQEADA
ncbi:glutathione S-transferase N-terminal domain-containing protein [Psychrobium sp. 1_MG-2023]|uniref:glutathione S-transferase N-terminal domain-containing protein n=1 Tax=Psychrobium sp. 1_MG-2023 TaxID=3062624 RepID=UPI000C344BA2|nr:glutathione S-transferase N-terminal domain-containing protein [Psychrobium sp. 1_MG-2023]MDP2562593.1 glutathione S-transferase N-terminal domain-containing protein [Psychrobium sp. 1_MG-2023]PKF59642.1 glutathione S-transferase [Alteromonadales bacterium alter-6D02]